MTPDIYLKLSSEKPKEISDIKNSIFMCLMREPKTGMGRYRAAFSEVSDRNYPKDLEFLGTCTDFQYPENELPHRTFNGLIEWHSIEEDVILGYEKAKKVKIFCK